MDTYKYLLWVPGNCASLRMAAQLLSDAAVIKLDSTELEWYYPLLTPFSEYIPVRCVSRNAADWGSRVHAGVRVTHTSVA